ncbi:sialate O-acetylesterase [Roseiconus lacunae]|uniref:sialate O-acetylesterase n=1 Tax=Roseiconus lacunae TaxID=2605694 RepID=UPI0011F3BD5C|nr:sialate O-acetylesterase [Roseiconus lacunae]
MNLYLRSQLAFVVIAMFGFAFDATAEVRLPGFFGDHMVLQQEKPIRIWGWADPSETVNVTLLDSSGTLPDRSSTATADQSGSWSVELDALTASTKPLTLTVAATNRIEINDVLVGEVWLCSGQSNMEWAVRSSSNAEQEIAAADFPLIRHIKFARRPSNDPLDDVGGDWQTCSPDTVGGFTACGYFMARRLHDELDVPIGLINSSWGGTRVEPWTPPIGFQQVEALEDLYRSVLAKTPGTDRYKELLSRHLESTKTWLAKAESSLQAGERVTASPSFPNALKPYTSHQDPTMLYNGMIHAIVGYPIRGAIWYQGESNHNEGMLYFEKKKALINGWRELWNQGDFPFYFVQIAPYQYGNEDSTILPRFWEAQAAVQSLPNIGMVVINDIATLNDIHPPNKQDVGERLALWALKHDYGKSEVVAASPSMKSMTIEGDQVIIEFENTGGTLKTRDGQPPSHFELIGNDSYGFQDATATIDGNRVSLRSASVSKPTAFRFAWHKLAEPNLTGATGLPVGAFRGGEVPEFPTTAAIEREFTLVYDLNLKTLGRSISYDVDKSDQVGTFDRVGYLVELTPSEGEGQKVFVAMDAFTDQAKLLGVPTIDSGAVFQQSVSNLDVFSNQSSITGGRSIATGNIEFWPSNYGQRNRSGVTGASNTAYDFGDDPGPPNDGYGSMQVHNPGAKQTIFAVNNWKSGKNADLGIGNRDAEHSDWTFSSNASSYAKARLRVYVRPRSDAAE